MSKMRILWLSMNPGLYGLAEGNAKHYNGGGWIASLQRLFISDNNIELALAFVTETQLEKKQDENFTYYPIISQRRTRWQKIKEYYGGYKNPNKISFLNEVQNIIGDFRPNIIHVFGMENPMVNVLGELKIPQIVHLQGLLIPCQNAYWPAGINEKNFIRVTNKREWLLRNGFIYSFNSMKVRSVREKELFTKVKYVMGRTQWDRNITELFAPHAKYYHVNEVLRPIFYENKGKWKLQDDGKFIILSVISENMYKGLDLIMKTAQMLMSLDIQFEWHVVGIRSSDRIVSSFESVLGINSAKVNIYYCGIMSAEDICKKALLSSLYVHPSYIDNSPNSLCEAQLLGMPVVATNVGGIPSLVEGCEPLQLVPANGVCELSHSIILLQKNPDLAVAIGRKGYKLADKRHNRIEIKKTLMETYQRVIYDY